MKNLKVFLTILFIASAFTAQAQKVKIKKGIVYVDSNEFLKIEGNFHIKFFLSTLNDDEFAVVNTSSYIAKEKVTRKIGKTGANYSTSIEEVEKYYKEIKFLDLDLNLETEDLYNKKKFFIALYKSKIIDDEGNLDEEKIARFISKYESDILKQKILND